MVQLREASETKEIDLSSEDIESTSHRVVSNTLWNPETLWGVVQAESLKDNLAVS